MKFPSGATARILALTDAASFHEAPSAALSPYLGRWGISPILGDGVVLGQARLAGRKISVLAQEPSFLGGAVGAVQAQRIAAHLRQALHEFHQGEIAGVLFLIESGGVRLHEANPALLGLASVLRALGDLRAASVPTVAVIPGNGGAFGGMSVVASACTALFFGAGARLGVSGPKVLETLRGKAAFDASDEASVDLLFGAAASAARGLGVALPTQPDAAKARLAAAFDSPSTGMAPGAPKHERRRFPSPHPSPTRGEGRVARRFVMLTPTLPLALDAMEGALLSRLQKAGKEPAGNPANGTFAPARRFDHRGWISQPGAAATGVLSSVAPAALGPAEALAMGHALRQWTREAPPDAKLVVLEDSPGHQASPEAEALGLPQYLAYLALCHAEARAAGRKEIGVLIGTGVSAAFFCNALQAPVLYALASGKVRLMDLRAMERVTGLPKKEVEKLLADDPVFGQEARHLQALGALAGTIQSWSLTELERLAAKS